MTGIRIAASIILALGVTSAHSAGGGVSELHVFSAIGMRQVMTELAPAFEGATGHTVQTTFAATGLLAKRIAAGERVDVVIINHASVEALM